jgi:acyl-CoA thioester hydrolase
MSTSNGRPQGSDEIPAPFAAATAVVLPEWIDYNGHMNVGYYHVAFDVAAEPFFEFLGFTPDYRKAQGITTFALESHLAFLREVKVGDRLRFEARLLDHDYKRVHFFQQMYHADEGYLAATYESVSAHVDMASRRTAPMGEALQARVAAVLAAHRDLPRPPQVGHVISAHPRPAPAPGA